MRGNIRTLSKRLHRKRRIKKVILAFFVFAVLFAGIAIISRSPFFKVKQIVIQGNDLISADFLKDKINRHLEGNYYLIFPRDNIFIMPKNGIKAEVLNNIARLKDVQLDVRLFSRNLIVKVVERSNAGIMCRAEDCFFMDESGFIFEGAPYFSGTIYTRFFDERAASSSAVIGTRILPEEEFKKLISFSELTLKKDVDINKIVLKEENIYEIYTLEGWRVLANSQNNPEDLFINLAVTLDDIKDKRKNLDYVDLRFGNKVFYKFK